MTKMTGTEKQVAWAEDIRAKTVPMVEAVVAETVASVAGMPEYVEMVARYEAHVAVEMARTDARYWIDRWANKNRFYVETVNARWIKVARSTESA